jgi:uncharacterized protein YbbK (DUF523 family)
MKLLISSCLFGENVRYDGKNSLLDKDIMQKLESNFELLPFCPEVSGGLPTPRVPSEIVSQTPLKLQNSNREDTTEFFVKGAELCLEFCKEQGIKVALLKSKSPSCGNEYVYDGTFSKKLVRSKGVTAKLLEENGIKVFNEHQLEELLKFKP